MARVTVITNDLDTQIQAVSALDDSHDVCALGYPDPRSGYGAIAASEPDVLVVDAAALRSPRGARLLSGELGGADADGALATQTRAASVLVLLDPGQEDWIIDCFQAGADDYLIKPVVSRELRGKVDGLQAARLGLLETHGHDPIAISDSGLILRADLERGGGDVDVQLGRYAVRGLLGRGGYGVVYRAHDVALDREVALKVLPKELHDNTEAVARFFREATAISRLNHPNIVEFYEVGSYRGRLYFTMELVEGRTLKKLAETERPMPVRRAAGLVAGIARALAAIDSLGLVHRDIKPENVLVTDDDQVKLIDFGLVRIRDTADITSKDDVLGTPYFMCPEYIRAPGIPDIRYDLYALGVTFFNLLSGEYPFDGKNAAHVMEKHLRQPAPRISAFQPGVPFLAERIIDRLLRKDPDERPQTAQEVLVLLEPLLRR